MLTVFCYDIGDDRRRRGVSKLLEEQASRVQHSVFETRMTEARAKRLSKRIAARLHDGDSLRVYVIGRNGERRTQVFGDGPQVQSDANFWLV